MDAVIYNQDYPRRLKAGVIGCGGHAYRNIFPAFRYAPVDLAAVCDINQSRADDAARAFGAKAVYTDHRQMLAREELEAVFVILNYDEHGHPRYPQIAIDAMRAGAHVWIEKPPAASRAEVQQMLDARRETGKCVGVGFKKMFSPANVKAREITQRPEFGAITTITARYPQGLPPAEHLPDDGKMVGFLDHMVHPYSLLRFLGGPIESLHIEREPRRGASFTTIRFTNGALGTLHLSAGQADQSPLERTEIIGEGANVVVENNLRVTYYRPGARAGDYGRAGNAYGADETAPLLWEPEFSLGQLYNSGLFLLGYAPELHYFSERALQNKPLEKGTLEDALEILTIYEAYRQPPGPPRQIAQGRV